MKLSVVSDGHGRILSLFPAPPHTGHTNVAGVPSGALTYQPNPGEKIHVVEIPREFEERQLRDVHTGFRVEVSESTAKLVPIHQTPK